MIGMRDEIIENFEKYELIEKNLLPQLSYFSSSHSLAEDAAFVGAFIGALTPLEGLALVQKLDENTAVWPEGSPLALRRFSAAVIGRLEQVASARELGGRIGEDMLREILGIDGVMPAAVWAICYEGKPLGLLLAKFSGGLPEAKEKDIALLNGLLGMSFAVRASKERERRCNFVFNTVLDDMKASIYVTEVETDKILYMNQTMKEIFKIKKPEGQVCWKVLQSGMTERCSFCPVKKLQESAAKRPLLQWEELNTRTGRSYQNYDSLIRWLDGKIVHLQQSVDVTDLKSANMDELTSLMMRRPGKSALRSALGRACRQKKFVTVALYDINSLKEVNDRYGHAEGDKMIATIAEAVRVQLKEGEFAFRLSGDEFVVLFDGVWSDAQRRMKKALRELGEKNLDYGMGFCYGLVEVSPMQPVSVEEILFLADSRMYEQKRHFHILRNQQRWQENRPAEKAAQFTYDKDLLYDALVRSTDDYIYVCNMKTGVFRYTRAMAEEFDLPGEVIENAAAVWGAKVHRDDRAAFLESNQEIADGRADAHCVEYRAQNRCGEWVWVRCRGRLEVDENGDPALFAGFITNLGKKNRVDHLTGLFNKLEFEDQVRKMIANEPGRMFGVMVLGIDDLKHINDLYNRVFGDEVIRIASQRIRRLLPGDASIYRLDGDEFGIVARGADVKELKRIYRAIYHSFENQQEYDGRKYYSTFSAGCLFYPQDADNFLDLVKYAGYSLEYAKTHGKKCCIFFSQEILGYRSRALAMLEALRESIENDFSGFSLRFQPLVDAKGGTLVGAEALARWQCAQFGQVPPVEFIPLLESSGMIVPVGKWVFRMALRACKAWLAEKPDLMLDVNLSYLQLENAGFVPFLRDVLAEEAYPACNLVVELTESYFARENQRVQAVFSELRSMGVRIAMDDFGTGYSTLGILKGVPADIVKIDKTFIKDIRTSNFDATFIRFIVELCHDVGIQVCLEGVENEADYLVVNKMGLDMIQGFLFDRPLTEEEFSVKYLAAPWKLVIAGTARPN